MANKPDCYKCIYRGEVPGSVHSSCKHPAFKAAANHPLAELMSIFASVGRTAPIQGAGEGITVKGDPYGIRSGWFNHPWSFDPVWLLECDGFKAKVA